MSSPSRKVAWAMVFATGLYVLLSGARYDAGHGLVYWAFVVAAETAAPFALLCVALTAGLFLRFLSTAERRGGCRTVLVTQIGRPASPSPVVTKSGWKPADCFDAFVRQPENFGRNWIP